MSDVGVFIFLTTKRHNPSVVILLLTTHVWSGMEQFNPVMIGLSCKYLLY